MDANAKIDYRHASVLKCHLKAAKPKAARLRTCVTTEANSLGMGEREMKE